MKTIRRTSFCVPPRHGSNGVSRIVGSTNLMARARTVTCTGKLRLAHATPFRICVGLLAVIAVVALSTGCVRRTLTITTEPPNALVYLNDLEVGRSTVTSDFQWYGDYSVVIRHEGYQTLDTHWNIKPPWYQLIPLDFVAEVLWPGQIHDQHKRHFVLEPAVIPTTDQLLGRALETRDRALDTRR